MTTEEENLKNRVKVLEDLLRRVYDKIRANLDSELSYEVEIALKLREPETDGERFRKLYLNESVPDPFCPSPERRKELDKHVRRTFNEATGGPKVE
jgi:hypothetical protein